jgi:CBS domain-containing protein
MSTGATFSAGDAVRGLNPHVRVDQPLDEVLEALLADMSSGPGLVMDDGAVVGVVSLHRLRRYRRTEWSDTTAREAMIPLIRVPAIDQNVSVRRLLNELTDGHTDLLLVTGPDGVVGALDRRIAIEKLIDRVQAAQLSR